MNKSQVDAAVVNFVPRTDTPITDGRQFEQLQQVVQFGFLAKQKTLRNNLVDFMLHNNSEKSRAVHEVLVVDRLRQLGLDVNVRPGVLTTDQWCQLTALLCQK